MPDSTDPTAQTSPGPGLVPPDPVEPLLRYFAFEHLHEPLRDCSAKFHALASWIVTSLPRNPERTVALRKLLEAKDCAVRALLP